MQHAIQIKNPVVVVGTVIEVIIQDCEMWLLNCKPNNLCRRIML